MTIYSLWIYLDASQFRFIASQARKNCLKFITETTWCTTEENKGQVWERGERLFFNMHFEKKKRQMMRGKKRSKCREMRRALENNVEILRIKSWPFRTVNRTFTKCLRQMNRWNCTSKLDLVTKKFFLFCSKVQCCYQGWKFEENALKTVSFPKEATYNIVLTVKLGE